MLPLPRGTLPDGDPKSAYGRRCPAGLTVATVVCNPTRKSQRWLYALGRLLNMESKLCLHAPSSVLEGGTFVPEQPMHLGPCTEEPSGLWTMQTQEDGKPPRFGMLPG